ncbi:MAG TPA: outer membrane beta-barrel protein [Gemmatimonadales bacterium]|nr:outer membrane beta-barrel protein [Gemmatimonadales bacterium]
MSRIRTLLAGVALVGVASSAMAQERNIQLQLLGGGYSHTTNLNATGPISHFRPGFNIAAAVGWNANKYVGVHGDFTFSRNQGLGVEIGNRDINHYYYGAHIEFRYPVSSQFSPFIFGGAGAVTVTQRQNASVQSFPQFTKAAGMFGAGMAYSLPNAPVDILAEGKVLTYRWNALGFDRNQWDVAYSLGFAYRFKI